MKNKSKKVKLTEKQAQALYDVGIGGDFSKFDRILPLIRESLFALGLIEKKWYAKYQQEYLKLTEAGKKLFAEYYC